METKLTLSIEADLAQTIRVYANRRGFTLSTLVENYFFSLIDNEKMNETNLESPLSIKLFGSLNAPDNPNYKEELINSLTEKYQ